MTWMAKFLIFSIKFQKSSTNLILFDINYVVLRLSRYLSDPREKHMRAAKRVIRYLLKTRTYGIVCLSNSQKELTCFCDANFASESDADCRSTTGSFITYADIPVSWKSKLQTMVAVSTPTLNILMGQVLSPKGQNIVTPRIWHSESATDCFLVSPNMHGQTRLDFAANPFRSLLPLHHVLLTSYRFKKLRFGWYDVVALVIHQMSAFFEGYSILLHPPVHEEHGNTSNFQFEMSA